MAWFDNDTNQKNIQKAFDCEIWVARHITSLTHNALDAKERNDETYYERAIIRLESYMRGVEDAYGFGINAYCSYEELMDKVEDRGWDANRIREWLKKKVEEGD